MLEDAAEYTGSVSLYLLPYVCMAGNCLLPDVSNTWATKSGAVVPLSSDGGGGELAAVRLGVGA